MITLDDFHTDFLQGILSDTESRGLMKPQAFLENVCEELIKSGDLTNNYTFAEYTKKGLEVHGYDYDEERRILSLIVHQFFQDEKIQTLKKDDIDTKFNRLKSFFKFCQKGSYSEMEETSQEFSMAYNIYRYIQSNQIDKIRLIILTDGKATRTLIDLKPEVIFDIETEFRIVDIDYIYKLYLSDNVDSSFEINIETPLPCLKVISNESDYQSYLCVISGDFLFKIYEDFGQKLFEQNVRTFLQFKTSVNKGIRNTIETNPIMFFAYNNGITATASNVEFDNNGCINKIENFQIVNGGQTTSAIYAAKKNSKLDVSKISVQMKLSVVNDPDKQNDFVSKVSRFANTQNKVKDSDFFSNSPFHKDMKTYSKIIWSPSINGSQKRTKWFYERSSGEYLNEQIYLKPSEKDKFKLEHPKAQELKKEFVGKSEMSWLMKPHIVAKGSAYCFSEFAKNITDEIEKDDKYITENYFKEVVSRVILFKKIEELISKAEWFDNAYRAQTVTYTISYLAYLVEKNKKFFNFNIIWERQSLPNSLIEILKKIIKFVYDDINQPPSGSGNISQWCKKEDCWKKVKNLDLDITLNSDLLIEKEEKKICFERRKKVKVNR